MNGEDNIKNFMEEFRKRFPDFKVVTATQINRAGDNRIIAHRGRMTQTEIDIVVVDHVSLIKRSN